MKIAFFEATKGEKDFFSKELKGNKLVFFKDKLTKRNIRKIKDAEVLVLFINSIVGRDELDKMSKLKYIATTTTGYDHIDIEECKKRGVKVSNVPYYGENTVAEHTMALILALSRNLYKAIEKTKNDDFSFRGLEGFDLKGKTLGVIGAGHIGQNVMRYARAFGMKVIAVDPHKDKKIEKEIGFKYVTLDYLLENSDIITIHARLSESTRHMINIHNVKKIKKGAYLVNTARGAIFETDALMYALDKGIISGAALDVLEGESNLREEAELLKKEPDKKEISNFISNHLIMKRDDVIVTPHSAFYSKEAVQRILDTTLENIMGFLKGRIKNRVI